MTFVCLCFASCSLEGWIKTPVPTVPHRAPVVQQKKEHVRVCVFSHGWHSGIVIPSAELKRTGWTRDLKLAQNPQLEFGWGAEEFYRKPDITLPMIFRGLCYPTDAVVHVERFPESPYLHYPRSQLVTLEVSRAEAAAMIAKLRESFLTKERQLVNLGPGIEKDSTFFRSRQKYYYPETCNVWTARILKAGGIKVSGSTKSPQLMKELRASPKCLNHGE